MKILLTGGTGLIGKQLGIELVKKGHTIVGITRSIEAAKLNAPYPADWVETNLTQNVPDLSAYRIDGVIHLAGENVGDKNWSDKQKQKIKDSRTQGTKNLLAAIKDQPSVGFFLGASAVGYYDPTQMDFYATEKTPRGEGFLAEVTDEWERSSDGLDSKIRKVLFRIGVVLSTEGGALPKMIFPAQIFASSSIGSGYQWMSWIHIHDVLKAFIFAIEKPIDGTFNLVSPHSSQQKDLAKHIKLRLNSLSGPPVPGFMLKTIMGEQASLALNSLRVSSQKLVDAGFEFDYPNLSRALKDLLEGWRDGKAVKTFRQFFNLPRAQVFEFFSEAKNLERITPDLLSFQMTGSSTDKIQSGTLIDYKLKVHGIPMSWTTEITTWDPPNQFTDIQLKGPYTHWNHTHKFEDLAGGTLMTDFLTYKVPIGLIGRMTTQAWIDNDIENIFEFRRKSVGQYL